MANTSGSANISRTAGDIINQAVEELGRKGIGQTLDSDEMAAALKAFNDLKDQLSGPENLMMPGLKLWKRKHLTLDLTDTAEYVLKLRRLAFTSGGTTAIAVGNTITGATSNATAKVMSVELTSGTWAGGDAAGELIIESQSGTFQSENLNVGASENLATIAADSKQIGPPTEIVSAVRRNSDGEDTPMSVMHLSEYMGLGDKDAEGDPDKIYYEARKDELFLYLNYKPATTTDTIFMVVLLPIQDCDSQSDELDCPRYMHRMFKWLMVREMAGGYGKKLTPEQKDLVKEAVALANSFHPEHSEMFFEPDRDD